MSIKKELRAQRRNTDAAARAALVASAYNSPRDNDSVPTSAAAQPAGPAFTPVVAVQSRTPWLVIAGSIASVAALAIVLVMISRKG